ncbi:MAG TPA: AraC family transcriptional regulator [Vicinamibacteria bacterium]|jgi:AraC-like DNA-binding protein|nr:AraC family transcriptional regulator [Vicinamibacteria bacterium]
MDQENRQRCSDLARLLHRFAAVDGLHHAPSPGVHCIRYSKRDRPTKRQWRACLAIVAQGCKEVVVGSDTFVADAGQFTAAPIHLPVISRIAAAAPDSPFLAILIDLEPRLLNEAAALFEAVARQDFATPARGFFRGTASAEMLDAAVRLATLLQSEDAQALGPLVVKELLYHLLKGPEGPAIRQFARSGTVTHRISRAVFEIRSDLGDDVDVAALAKAARMSRSAFFKHFKAVTSLSPIQYQKRLRLLEAQRLMVDHGETAEQSSFRVGYTSASQFSREYLRMFGESPLRHVIKLKRAGVAGREI